MLHDFVTNEDYADHVTTVVYHAYSDPWYNINGDDHDTRFQYYSVTGIPSVRLDGILGNYLLSASDLTTPYGQRYNVESPLSISIMSINNEDEINVTALVTSGDEEVPANLKIRMALVSLFYDNFTGNNGQSEWHWDMLDMAPDAAGQDFEIGLNETVEYSATFPWPFTLQQDEVAEDNAKIVVWVQNDTNHEVLQSEWAEIGGGYMFEAEPGLTEKLVAPGSEAEFSFDITNTGMMEDTYDIAITSGLLEDWSYTYTTPDGEQNAPASMTLAPEATFTSTVTLSTAANIPASQGSITITITSQNSPFISCEMTFYAMANGQILVLNGDTEGRYSEYYTNALHEVTLIEELNEDLNYSVWTAAEHPFHAGDLDEATPELVIWYVGGEGNITDADETGLMSYLDDGGSLWITGSSAAVAMDGGDLIGYMGASFQDHYSRGYNVHGEEGDLYFDGLETPIMEGDGADNRGVPSALYATDDGTVCLMYSTIRVAGIRRSADTYNTLLFGFPFEAIASQEARTTCMLDALHFLIDFNNFHGITDTPDLLPSAFSLQQNYPNPFNPETEIRFTLPERAMVHLAVFDITGREVARLTNRHFEAGQHSLHWNAADQASGVYFLRMTAIGNTPFEATRKMVLVK